MKKYSAQALRDEFVNPLSILVSELSKAASDLESAWNRQEVGRDWLPLNEGYALDAVKDLRKFLRTEVTPKLGSALDGTLRYRESELSFEKTDGKKPATKPRH